MLNKYIFSDEQAKHDVVNNAGSKAGKDILCKVKEMQYKPAPIYSAKNNKVVSLISEFININKFASNIKKGDLVLLQYPATRPILKIANKALQKRGSRIIYLIHDIDFLRDVKTHTGTVEDMKKQELSILKGADVIIAHNQSMIKELSKCLPGKQFVSLDLFDYVYEGVNAQRTDDDSVIVAGNLLEKKAGYIYSLKNQKFKLNLYGSNLNESFNNDNAEYKGSFSPDELIPNLKGSYGLVWDGSSAETCEGSYGRYLKYNNPHKVSLYIAAGLPVIVWKQSALYPFVAKNGLGFGVNSLYEIDDLINQQDYELLCNNVELMQAKVRSGYFITKALEEAEGLILT